MSVQLCEDILLNKLKNRFKYFFIIICPSISKVQPNHSHFLSEVQAVITNVSFYSASALHYQISCVLLFVGISFHKHKLFTVTIYKHLQAKNNRDKRQ